MINPKCTPTLDLFEERVVRDVLCAALQANERRPYTDCDAKARAAALRKALSILTEERP